MMVKGIGTPFSQHTKRTPYVVRDEKRTLSSNSSQIILVGNHVDVQSIEIWGGYNPF